MIAHVAEAGEGRGRVVLHLTSGPPNRLALLAAIKVAQAFQSEIESLFVEDAKLFDIAGFPFAREISLSGRRSKALTLADVERQMRSRAAALADELGALARGSEVPMHMTIVRDEPVNALASACDRHGPWNVVALAEPVTASSDPLLDRIFTAVPGTTGLVVVGPKVRRCDGRIVAFVEDIADFDAVLRTARRLHALSPDARLTLLLAADTDREAAIMDDQARLAIGADDTLEIVRARVERHAPAVAAEIIRRLGAGFVVGRFGGLVVPSDGCLRRLASVLDCPLFLMR
jgi:hypothetical protein